MSTDQTSDADATMPTDSNVDADGTIAPSMSTADAIAVPEGAVGGPPPTAPDAAATTEPATAAATEADAAATTDQPAATPAEPVTATPTVVPVRTAGSVALVIGRRLLRFAFTLALLGLGVYAGWQFFETNRPVPTVVGDPAVLGVPTPPAVAELAAAIGADDANGIRVALSSEIFSSYTSDMERFGIVRVDGVATLGTYADGPRSATALAILGRTVDGSPFTINLVVIAQDGQIVRLR